MGCCGAGDLRLEKARPLHRNSWCLVWGRALPSVPPTSPSPYSHPSLKRMHFLLNFLCFPCFRRVESRAEVTQCRVGSERWCHVCGVTWMHLQFGVIVLPVWKGDERGWVLPHHASPRPLMDCSLSNSIKQRKCNPELRDAARTSPPHRESRH